MKRQLLRNLTAYKLLLASIMFAPAVLALSTDKNQDIEIESNSVYLDDTRNVGIYTGAVVVIQGSMSITGDTLTIFYTEENELEKIIVEGQPATFRQLPDKSQDYDEAEALMMEYYEADNLIILTNKARVKQGDRRLIAEHIEYDTEQSQVRAKGTAQDNTISEDSRVKLIIPGKNTNPDSGE